MGDRVARDPQGERLVFTGGAVFDGHHHRSDLSVGVRGGRIVAMGDVSVVREAVGAGAREVPIGEGLLLPGFQDAHMHPLVGGLERRRGELTGLDGPEQYLAALAREAERQRGDSWFRAGGWTVDAFPGDGPTAAVLDRLTGDQPAYVPSADHHDAGGNNQALELAAITASTPDPDDGWIVRDASGSPTGVLREGAQRLVWDHVQLDPGEARESLLEAQEYLHGWGVTAWHDALIGGYASLDDPTEAYLSLLEDGLLTAQVTASQWWDPRRGMEQVEELVDRSEELGRRGLRAHSVKIMMDGITETLTASVTDPWLGADGCPCGGRGLPFLERGQAREVVTALDAAGLAVHVHAIGDRAVHDALDAVEHARVTNGMSDRRHQLAHIQLVAPADRPRFRDLGVVPNLQGMWVPRSTAGTAATLAHLDAERVGWNYPFADVCGPGVVAAGGSDWPVNPPEPLQGVHALVNRRAWSRDGSPEEPLTPEQALSVEQALAAYTSGSAWVSHRHDSGELRVGSRADLVLLDRDVVTGPAEEIGAAEVAATWALGRLVHQG